MNLLTHTLLHIKTKQNSPGDEFYKVMSLLSVSRKWATMSVMLNAVNSLCALISLNGYVS